MAPSQSGRAPIAARNAVAASWLQSLIILVRRPPRTARLSHLFLSVESAIGLPAKQASYGSPPPGQRSCSRLRGCPVLGFGVRGTRSTLLRHELRSDIPFSHAGVTM